MDLSYARNFDASRGAAISQRPRIVDRNLVLKGLKLDAVKSVCRDSISSLTWFLSLFSWVATCRQLQPCRGQPSPEALWRTLILNLDLSNKTFPAPDHYSQLFHNWAQIHLACYFASQSSDLIHRATLEKQYEDLRSTLCSLDSEFSSLVPDLTNIKQKE